MEFERERGVTSVTVTSGITHLTARFPSGEAPVHRLILLHQLAQAQIPIFLVKLHPDAISFAVRENHASACESLLRQDGIEHTLLHDLSLIRTIAGAMRDLSGVIAQIYEALLGAHVRVRQTGDAYNAVLVLVAGDDAQRAADALRAQFEIRSAT